MLPILLATLAAIMSVWAIVYSVRLYAPAFQDIRRDLANGGATTSYRYAIRTSNFVVASAPIAIGNAILPDRRIKRANSLRYSTAVLAKAA